MCNASLYAENTRDGVTGDICDIGLSPRWDIPALLEPYSPGQLKKECVVCVQTDSKLTISDISPEVQKKYAIGEVIEAWFVQAEGDRYDVVKMKNGYTIELFDLARYGAKAEILYASSRKNEEMQSSAAPGGFVEVTDLAA
jgi:hypothetical protein